MFLKMLFSTDTLVLLMHRLSNISILLSKSIYEWRPRKRDAHLKKLKEWSILLTKKLTSHFIHQMGTGLWSWAETKLNSVLQQVFNGNCSIVDPLTTDRKKVYGLTISRQIWTQTQKLASYLVMSKLLLWRPALQESRLCWHYRTAIYH